ncbi:MAG: hypothetical protein EOO50_09080 [Flavobacterium sp.]|uniref:hypothetical protein n=1 Tax=Flavobacterium sp. TaxID=239 RepID=UPI0011FA7E27|nr:hypothetical protein [Flavobacterium sp.]RZJ66667.1 MAG: hypothetical protein EOO50_09080 [Flavobacterium sp.]
METNRDNFASDRDDQRENGEVLNSFQEPEGIKDGDLSDRDEHSHDRKKHHDHHHIGRYRSFSNYSSASGQPSTNTGPGLF